MDRFWEFILANLYFLLILAGGVLTVVRKTRQQRSDGSPPVQRPVRRPAGRPAPRMPDFGGGWPIPAWEHEGEGPSRRPDLREEREEPAAYQTTVDLPTADTRPDRLAFTMDGPDIGMEHEITDDSDRGKDRFAAPSPAAGGRQEKGPWHEIRDDAVRGIIWGELLGPPRAKRPHGRRW